VKLKDRVGQCYELSFQEMRRGAWDYLAHGYLHYMGACIYHAWVEKTERVDSAVGTHLVVMAFDPVWGAYLPRDAYYRMFDAQDINRYTRNQACEHALRTGVHGPWVEIDTSRLKLLSADEDGFTRSGPCKAARG